MTIKKQLKQKTIQRKATKHHENSKKQFHVTLEQRKKMTLNRLERTIKNGKKLSDSDKLYAQKHHILPNILEQPATLNQNGVAIRITVGYEMANQELA